MKQLSIILLIAFSLILSNCSKKDDIQPKKETKTEQNNDNNKSDIQQKKYWVNSSSNVIHNRTCRWYNNTKKGYFTDKCIGKSYGICGGCE